jgi:hypothetical protein
LLIGTGLKSACSLNSLWTTRPPHCADIGDQSPKDMEIFKRANSCACGRELRDVEITGPVAHSKSHPVSPCCLLPASRLAG